MRPSGEPLELDAFEEEETPHRKKARRQTRRRRPRFGIREDPLPSIFWRSRAWYHWYWTERDRETALKELKRAQGSLPEEWKRTFTLIER